MLQKQKLLAAGSGQMLGKLGFGTGVTSAGKVIPLPNEKKRSPSIPSPQMMMKAGKRSPVSDTVKPGKHKVRVPVKGKGHGHGKGHGPGKGPGKLSPQQIQMLKQQRQQGINTKQNKAAMADSFGKRVQTEMKGQFSLKRNESVMGKRAPPQESGEGQIEHQETAHNHKVVTTHTRRT